MVIITNLEKFVTTVRVFFVLLALLFLSACAPLRTQSVTPPRLYVFDVSDLHLNHYALCGGPCPADTAPPNGKTFADLLNDYDALIFLSSLQGIVNKKRPQLYLIHHPGDQFWLDAYQEAGQPYGWLNQTEIIPLPDFEAVLDTFDDQITGLVEWDDAVPATLNVATTIAGIEDWPIVRRKSALAKVLSARWPVAQSLAGQFTDNLAAYRWAVETYLQTGRANFTLLAYLEDGYPAQKYRQGKMTRGGVYALERDYVIQQGGFAFDLSPWQDEAPQEAELMSQIMQAARREAGLKLIKIWGFIPWYEKYAAEAGTGGSHSAVEGEWESTWLFSYYAAYLQGGGGDAWGAAMANVSVHRFAPKPGPVSQWAGERVSREDKNSSFVLRPSSFVARPSSLQSYLLPDGSVNPELTFVLFYAGDYDLVHPTLVSLAAGEKSTWNDGGRGQIPLAWGINPGMEEEIPGVMSYLLATRTEQDYLVGANSGAGYINPQGLSRRYRQQWLTRSGDYYRKYGITVQGFLLNGRGYSLPPKWVARFAKIAPDGIAEPYYEIEGNWPRLVGSTPYIGIPKETLGDSVADSAQNAHTVYRRNQAEGRPPFLVFRSAFQSPQFLADVFAEMQRQDVAGEVLSETGEVLHPNYRLLDPYTFFALLEQRLRSSRSRNLE